MSEDGRQDAVTSGVVSYIRRQIISGKWEVGSKIPSENQLRTRLNVSRTSLRSAIMQLSALNILKAKQGVGTFVVQSPHDDSFFEGAGKSSALKNEIVQILEFLKILAPDTIFTQMKKTPESFSKLEKDLAEALCNQRNLAVSNQKEFLDSCFEFHTLIFGAIENEFTKCTVLEAIRRLRDAVKNLNPTISTQVILTLHNKMIEAIVADDPKRARFAQKKLYAYLTAHDYLRALKK